jgi:hypothetical protein
MAKKYKRNLSAAQARPSDTVESAAVERPSAMFARRGTAADFNPDYTYVLSDLKRIGLISGIFVVVLVALHFILG